MLPSLSRMATARATADERMPHHAASRAVNPLRARPPRWKPWRMSENPTELTGADAIARVKDLVEDIDFAMLTTTDDSGHLVSRPMSTREMDENGDIWFFTSEDTKKVDEVEADRDVGLSYLDAKGMRFVSVGGTARVVHDRAKMAELYSPSLDIWFEDGLDTPGIALLRVTPKETEFWEPAHGKVVMAAGMLKALVTRDTPDNTMRHGRISC